MYIATQLYSEPSTYVHLDEQRTKGSEKGERGCGYTGLWVQTEEHHNGRKGVTWCAKGVHGCKGGYIGDAPQTNKRGLLSVGMNMTNENTNENENESENERARKKIFFFLFLIALMVLSFKKGANNTYTSRPFEWVNERMDE